MRCVFLMQQPSATTDAASPRTTRTSRVWSCAWLGIRRRRSSLLVQWKDGYGSATPGWLVEYGLIIILSLFQIGLYNAQSEKVDLLKQFSGQAIYDLCFGRLGGEVQLFARCFSGTCAVYFNKFAEFKCKRCWSLLFIILWCNWRFYYLTQTYSKTSRRFRQCTLTIRPGRCTLALTMDTSGIWICAIKCPDCHKNLFRLKSQRRASECFRWIAILRGWLLPPSPLIWTSFKSIN